MTRPARNRRDGSQCPSSNCSIRMTAAMRVARLSRAKMLLGMLLVSLAASAGVANAKCAAGVPPAYEDIDRILLVRCQPITQAYPCFSALISLNNQYRMSGDLDALKGVGLRGHYGFSASDRWADRWNGYLLVDTLYYSGFLNMAIAPLRPVIDGAVNLLSVRRCGTVTTIKSDGDIDDPAHIQWSVLLQRLQAQILSQHWVQSSPSPTGNLFDWFRGEITPQNRDQSRLVHGHRRRDTSTQTRS